MLGTVNQNALDVGIYLQIMYVYIGNKTILLVSTLVSSRWSLQLRQASGFSF